MNQMNFSRIVNELNLFEASLKQASDPMLAQLAAWIADERERRLGLQDLEPMTDEEGSLPRIDAIRAYRFRTNAGLRQSMEAHNRYKKSKQSGL